MNNNNTVLYLEELVKDYDKDRFIVSLFSSNNYRDQFFTLFAFNIEISRIWETVQEESIRHLRLQWWYDVVSKIEKGNNPAIGHPVVESLFNLSQSKEFSFKYLYKLLDTKRFDLDNKKFSTFEDLIDYCKGSCSSLYFLLLETLSIEGKKEYDLVDNLSVAWALTGSIRSILKSSSVGKILIPSDLMSKYNLVNDDILDKNRAACLSNIIYIMTHNAKEYLEKAVLAEDVLPKRALPLILLLSITRHYLDVIEKSNFNLYDKRVILMKPKLINLTLLAAKKRYFNL